MPVTFGKNSFHFSGKVRDLEKYLQHLAREYSTVRELIDRHLH